MLKRVAICGGIAALISFTVNSVTSVAQGRNGIGCLLALNSTSEVADFRAVVSTSFSGEVAYDLSIVKVDGSGSSTTNQSGVITVVGAEQAVIGRITIGVGPNTLIEGKLELRELLTGNTCEATRTYTGII